MSSAAQAEGPVHHPLLERLVRAVEHAGHLLPDQGPIATFIHHNTLHAFQDLPFHEAVLRAQEELGGEPYWSEQHFRSELHRGRIDLSDLEDAFAADAGSVRQLEGEPLLAVGLPLARVRQFCFLHGLDVPGPAELRYRIEEGSLLLSAQEDANPEAISRIITETTDWMDRLRSVGRIEEFRLRLTGSSDLRVAEATTRARSGGLHGLDELWRARHSDVTREAAAFLALWQRSFELTAEVAPEAVPSGASKALLIPREVDLLVDPILSRLAKKFLDEGLAYWPMPKRELGFYRAVRWLAIRSAGWPVPWLRPLIEELRDQERCGLGAEEAALRAFQGMGIDESELEALVERSLLALPGWAGLMGKLERSPAMHPLGSRVRLVDYLAVRLTYERFALEHWRSSENPARAGQQVSHSDSSEDRHLVRCFRMFRLFQLGGVSAWSAASLSGEAVRRTLAFLARLDPLTRRRLFQEAYEGHYRNRILSAFAQVPRRAAPEPRAQVLFCLDEREESIRRHLEETDPSVETFGVAGFFGLAIEFKGLEVHHTQALCPVAVTPSHRIEERTDVRDEALHARRRRFLKRRKLAQSGAFFASRGLFRATLLTLLGGLLALLPLLLRIWSPRRAAALAHWIDARLSPPPRTVLSRQRAPDDVSEGLPVGLTLAEQIDRVAPLFQNAGLTRNFAPVLVALGHGSTSRNNPHESAHDCGACGGSRGGPNARLLAEILRDPEVRAELRGRGVFIPDDTLIVGGLHDTASDEITLFDLDLLSEEERRRLEPVIQSLDEARGRNAQERCRRFESAGPKVSPREALHHVADRTEHLAEPRPEYGHATNAVCFVGPRTSTRGLFLDRRAFLVSYDPSADRDGAIIERLLGAITPVVAGISLEYYFSFIDPERYGCGTKLPQNIAALVGVMNGHGGDLRTGLPWQMVEIHEPMRPLMILETTPAILRQVLNRQAEVREFVENEWLQVVVSEPDGRTHWRYLRGEFVRWTGPKSPLETARSSAEWYEGRSEHLDPAFIESGVSAS